MASIAGIPETIQRKWLSERIVVITVDQKLVSPEELQRQMDKLREQIDRLAAVTIQKYEDHDVVFGAAPDGSVQPVLHGLGLTPTGYYMIFWDMAVPPFALPTAGWGPKVVYFQCDIEGRARVRLFCQ